jgi:hypothetical protein
MGNRQISVVLAYCLLKLLIKEVGSLSINKDCVECEACLLPIAYCLLLIEIAH